MSSGHTSTDAQEHIDGLVEILTVHVRERERFERAWQVAEDHCKAAVARSEALYEALHAIVLRAMEVPVGAPSYPLARGLGDIAVKAMEAGREQ